jgi:biotin carboxylase
MVGDPPRRVLLVFEMPWDRKQLDACRDAWQGRVEPVFSEPSDLDCPAEFDALGFIEALAAGALGRIDGAMSSSDYPGTAVAAALAARLGLPGPRPQDVIRASHKYYSRVAQQRAAPEAVPRFALLDVRRPERADPPLPHPLFVKPVKGAFSVLARRVESRDQLQALLASDAVQRFADQYMRIFNQLLAALTPFDIDGGHFIAEELIDGHLATVEGFVCEGEVGFLGVVDSVLHPVTRSFARFDYPSGLPEPVQERMRQIGARVVRALGLERAMFNIEMAWNPATDRIAIIEVNPRLAGQFADLYRKVDGTSGYEVALALCTGERPRLRRRAGPCGAASSVPLRAFEPARVRRAPDPREVAQIEAAHPGTLIWSECRGGEVLDNFEGEDGASHRYAVINAGGADRDELDARLQALQSELDYRLEPL